MTSIEWLRNELVNNENIRWRGTNINVLIEQAKDLHKAETLLFATEYDEYVFRGGSATMEEYYEETFKNQI